MSANLNLTACFCLAIALGSSTSTEAFAQQSDGRNKSQSLVLPPPRTGDEIRYGIRVDITVDVGPGKKREEAAYEFELNCEPRQAQRSPGSAQRVRYRCARFSILDDGKETATVPAMSDLTYHFAYPSPEISPDGNVYGLPHARFQGLQDSNGNVLGPQNDFLVYNAFTDYHVLCNVYAQPTLSGGGIQNLSRVGDDVTHVTSQTRTPLGDIPGLKKGSEFVHGNVLLTLNDVQTMNHQEHAVVSFSAKDNRIKTIIEPFDGFVVTSQGTSSHTGKIWIDLSSGWVAKASMRELVKTRLNLNGKQGDTVVTARKLSLRRKDDSE